MNWRRMSATFMWGRRARARHGSNPANQSFIFYRVRRRGCPGKVYDDYPTATLAQYASTETLVLKVVGARARGSQHAERDGGTEPARDEEAHLPRALALVGGRLSESALPKRRGI